MEKNTFKIKQITHFLRSFKIAQLAKSPVLIPLFYLCAGVFLFFFLVVMFQTYVLSLKVESAVVSADIETIVSPVSGYISKIFVNPGEKVKQGMPLLKIENLDMERRLRLALLNVYESKMDRDYYQKLLLNEQQRVRLYKEIGTARVNAAETFIKISQQELLMAQHTFDRFSSLKKKQFMSDMDLEMKRAEFENAQQKLKHARVQYEIEKSSLSALDKGLYFTGNKAEGIEQDLSAELETTKQKVHLNKLKVKVYKNLIEKLTLSAPFDGRITQVLKTAGNTTDNIKPIIFIERGDTGKRILAYLTQEEVVRIGSAEKVKIYIPSTGHTYKGKILELNRSEGFVDAVKAQYRWRDFQIDKSAMVTIAVQQADQKKFDKEVYPGMPVVVYFKRTFNLALFK